MKPMLGIGVALFALGLFLAAIGVLGVGSEGTGVGSGLVIPITAGLALASGAVLTGLSFGNWRHPRTHSEPGDGIVDPEGTSQDETRVGTATRFAGGTGFAGGILQTPPGE